MDLIKRIFTLSVFFVLALLCCNINNLYAATYYVSPDGTNTWPYCTSSENPCPASGTHKEFLGARAGDTVFFLSGTYDTGTPPANYEIPAWNPTNSGSSGYPITFKCLSGTCTIQGPTTNSPAFGTYGKSWIVWDGFTGTKSTGADSFVRFGNCNDVTIQNYDLKGTASSGSLAIIIMSHTVTNLTIKNNKLHGQAGSQAFNSPALMLYHTTNALVENNEFYDNSWDVFDKVNGQRNTYRFNLFKNSWGGFLLGTEGTGNPSNIKVYQNVFIGHVKPLSTYGGLDKNNVYFYNNSIYTSSGETTYGILHEEAGRMNVWEVFNNLVMGFTYGIYAKSQDSNIYYDYNDYYSNTYVGRMDSNNYTTIANWRTALGGCPGTGRECNSNTDNPNFVNAGGNTAADYKRTSYQTNGRGGGYPNVMGAYITGNEIIGIGGGSMSPKPPTGVRIIPSQ